jgi:glutamate dehydrogenase (NADP+)
VTLSVSSGYIFAREGVDREALDFIVHLKNVRRGRVEVYAETSPKAVYSLVDPDSD